MNRQGGGVNHIIAHHLLVIIGNRNSSSAVLFNSYGIVVANPAHSKLIAGYFAAALGHIVTAGGHILNRIASVFHLGIRKLRIFAAISRVHGKGGIRRNRNILAALCQRLGNRQRTGIAGIRNDITILHTAGNGRSVSICRFFRYRIAIIVPRRILQGLIFKRMLPLIGITQFSRSDFCAILNQINRNRRSVVTGTHPVLLNRYICNSRCIGNNSRRIFFVNGNFPIGDGYRTICCSLIAIGRLRFF